MWQIPDAVDTVVCASDDEWRYHPKHVEQFPDIIKLCNVASCWIHIGVIREQILGCSSLSKFITLKSYFFAFDLNWGMLTLAYLWLCTQRLWWVSHLIQVDGCVIVPSDIGKWNGWNFFTDCPTASILFQWTVCLYQYPVPCTSACMLRIQSIE
jgi:hypothetical protein